eukprot:CAMPEP_0195635814 /NCGR_PEP_ID=MMETSP0815-20121206/23496_1 /TAXON_ID=97485 /ORGANISM="Prymnesium parvum, Strain Texoma1" /LENGTH=30 /DNA_ID= /DNA_START= /DNA_END= /DNA_ORIENTATION=
MATTYAALSPIIQAQIEAIQQPSTFLLKLK